MSQSFSRAVASFIAQMSADARAASSIVAYRRQLIALGRWLGDRPLKRVTPDEVNGFLISKTVALKRDGTPKRASTFNRTKSIVRSFFAWCEASGRVARSPADHVRRVAACEGATRHMTREELQRFLETTRRARHPLSSRDHANFATLAYTGMRLTEAVSLTRTDIDWRRGEIIVRRVKGGRAERRHLPVVLRPILARLAGVRPAGVDPSAPLFTSARGGPLSPRSVQYRFVFWLRGANIEPDVSVHSLRHTFGTLLYRKTKDLVLVGRALGHRDVRSTQRYAHLERDRALAEAVDAMW